MNLKKYKMILGYIFITIHIYAYDVGLIKRIYMYKESTLYTNIYYPSLSNIKSILLGDNAIFKGIYVKENAEIYNKKFPLIILIHGSGGNNTSLNYIVEALVSKGIIVVAANYERISDDTLKSIESMEIWIQNENVSLLLDKILEDPYINKNVALNQIGIMGFSKGAYTAIAKAGGTLEVEKFSNYCRLNMEMPDCIFYESENSDSTILNKEKFEKSYVDKRFSYTVAIDPSLGSSFNDESIKAIEIPVLLILGDFYLPDHTNMRLLGNEIYKKLNKNIAYQKKIKNSGHFSFLAECKKDALKILEDESFICEDGPISRSEVHRETIDGILKFFKDINILTME